jgi:hypothetical protein
MRSKNNADVEDKIRDLIVSKNIEKRKRESAGKTPADFALKASLEPFKKYWYIEALSDRIAEGVKQGGFRLVISLPPRHGKSTLVSKWTPRWMLERTPSSRIILTSYNDQYAGDWGRTVRDGLRDSGHHKRAELSKDKDAQSNFETTEGGGMLSAGLRSGITGKGADLMIVDDPIKNWAEAQSRTVREEINNEFDSVINTRLEPGASVIVVMTRWHSEDLVGHIRDNYDWPYLRIPAIQDEKQEGEQGMDKREVGEALCPQRYDLDALNEKKSSFSQKMWLSIYQQTPVDEQEGSGFRYEYFDYPDNGHLPKFDRIVVAIDPATTSNEHSDETGIIVVALWNDQYWILDDASGTYTPREWSDKAVALYRKWEADKIIGESNNGGDLVESNVKNQDRDIPFDQVKATRGKAIRAEPVVGLYEDGRVTHREQFEQLESQMVLYAGEKSSESPDRMDALVWGVSYLKDDDGGSGGIGRLL